MLAMLVQGTGCGDGGGQSRPSGPGTIAFTASNYNVSQAATSVNLNVSRTGGSDGIVSLSYVTSDGTAAAGSDYTATSGTLTWATGDAAPKTILIPLQKSPPFFGAKTFAVAISSASGGATVGSPASAQVTINGSKATATPGTVGLAPQSYSVVQGDAFAITVTRMGGSDGAISISYATSDGTAVASQDYTATSGTLNWAAGEATSKTISVPVSNFPPFFGQKTLTLTLSDAKGGAVLGSPHAASLTINGRNTAPVPGQVSLSYATYSVSQLGASIVVTAIRTGGQDGAVAVHFSTSNGTAIANTDYTPQNGTLQWANWDWTPKRFAIPVSNKTPYTGTKTFTAALSGPVGGAVLGSISSSEVTIHGSVGRALAVSVSGNRLVDSTGATLSLHGVNLSGLEFWIVLAGYSPDNPWANQTGDPTPNWDTIKTWGVNSVRLLLNEASWLGLTCADEGGTGWSLVNGVVQRNPAGAVIPADPGGRYRSAVARSVSDATAAGLYVIIDLHWTAPGSACPMAQNAMADADHSLTFWTSVATAYKNYPNVIFELFNEPFLNSNISGLVDTAPWPDMLNGGGTLTSYLTGGSPATVNYTWKNAGYQQLLDTVRAAGANNVVLTGTLGYAQFIDGWLQWKPTDSAKQLGAVWHAYPNPAYPAQVGCPNLPQCSAEEMAGAQAILDAGYPVIITEFGDAIGGALPPMVSQLLPFADINGISYMGFTWDVWTTPWLITDAAGTPTAGYGVYVKQHFLCVAAGESSCP